MSEKFGKSEAEEHLQQIMVVREIVRKIVDYGVSQEQIVLIIQALGYELQNHEHMIEVVGLTKDILSVMKPINFVESV